MSRFRSSWIIPMMLVVAGLFVARSAFAGTVNYDPALPAPAPVLNAGWASDVITAAYTNSADSPYVFNLTDPAYFRITDDYTPGDQFFVYNFGNLILTTSYFTGGTLPSDNTVAAWSDPSYQHGQILLGAGSYDLTVQGDGAGGIPAGFWTRLDAQVVPLPAAFLAGLLLLGAMLSYRLVRRYRLATA